MKSEMGRPKIKIIAAQNWAYKYLDGGKKDQLAGKTLDAGVAAGHNRRTLRRALSEAGVERNPPGGGRNCMYHWPTDRRPLSRPLKEMDAERLIEFADRWRDVFYYRTEIRPEFDWTPCQFSARLKTAQTLLALEDRMLIPVRPPSGPTGYVLTDNSALIMQFAGNKTGMSRSNLVLALTSASALVSATDGRTREGIEARKLLADLEQIDLLLAKAQSRAIQASVTPNLKVVKGKAA